MILELLNDGVGIPHLCHWANDVAEKLTLRETGLESIR